MVPALTEVICYWRERGAAVNTEANREEINGDVKCDRSKTRQYDRE